jgi:hypothetical protein
LYLRMESCPKLYIEFRIQNKVQRAALQGSKAFNALFR